MNIPQICEIKLNIMNYYLIFNIFTFQILINKIFKNTPFPEIYFRMLKVNQRLVLGQSSSEKDPIQPSQSRMLGRASDQAAPAHPGRSSRHKAHQRGITSQFTEKSLKSMTLKLEELALIFVIFSLLKWSI